MEEGNKDSGTKEVTGFGVYRNMEECQSLRKLKKGLEENLTIVTALFTLYMLLYFSVHTFPLGYSDILFNNYHNHFVSVNKKNSITWI